MNRIAALILATLCFVAIPAQANELLNIDRDIELPSPLDTARSDEFSLLHNFQRGQSQSFNLSVNVGVDAPASPFLLASYRLEAPFRVEVLARTENEHGQLAWTFGQHRLRVLDSVRAAESERLQSGFSGLRLTRVLTTTGEIMEASLAGSPRQIPFSPSQLIADLSTLIVPALPAEPVRIGDSWVQEYPLTIGQQDSNITAAVVARYEVKGVAMVGGREALIISSDYQYRISGVIVQDDGSDRELSSTLRGQGTGWLALNTSNAQVIEHHFETGLAMMLTQAGSARGTILISLSGKAVAQ